MKTIYWIDDDLGEMFKVTQGLIKRLWNINGKIKDLDSVASKIIFLVNANREFNSQNLYSKKDEKYICKNIFNVFLEACMEMDGPNQDRPVFKEKKNLIDDPVLFLFGENNIKEYIDLKDTWTKTDFKSKNTDEYLKAKKKVAELIKNMKLCEDSIVGIDVNLFFDDVKLRMQEGKIVLSMELYYQLNKIGKKCFVYSAQADDYDCNQKWKKIYEDFYEEDSAEVYKRVDMMRNGEQTIEKEIINLLETLEDK